MRPFEERCEGAVASATGEADEPLGPPLERGQGQGGGQGLPAGSWAGIPVGLRDQPAEIPPPLPAFDQQREMEGRRRAGDVAAAGGADNGHLGPDDRADPPDLQAWAYSIAPQTPSWSVRARASWPSSAALRASSSGADAPSRKE